MANQNDVVETMNEFKHYVNGFSDKDTKEVLIAFINAFFPFTFRLNEENEEIEVSEEESQPTEHPAQDVPSQAEDVPPPAQDQAQPAAAAQDQGQPEAATQDQAQPEHHQGQPEAATQDQAQPAADAQDQAQLAADAPAAGALVQLPAQAQLEVLRETFNLNETAIRDCHKRIITIKGQLLNSQQLNWVVHNTYQSVVLIELQEVWPTTHRRSTIRGVERKVFRRLRKILQLNDVVQLNDDDLSNRIEGSRGQVWPIFNQTFRGLLQGKFQHLEDSFSMDEKPGDADSLGKEIRDSKTTMVELKTHRRILRKQIRDAERA